MKTSPLFDSHQFLAEPHVEGQTTTSSYTHNHSQYRFSNSLHTRVFKLREEVKPFYTAS